jgi:hypothetical protein
MTAMGYMQLSVAVLSYVPYLALIDRKGVIRAQWTGSDDFLKDEATQAKNIRGEIQKLLAEPAAKRPAARKR